MSYNLVHNLEHYKSCFCNRDGRGHIVELLDFPQDKRKSVHVFNQEILFMVKGSAYISMDGMGIGRRLKKWEFIFLPAGTQLSYDVARDSAFLVVRVEAEVPECSVFKMHRTPRQIAMDATSEGIHALKAEVRVRSLVAELMVSLEDGFLCRHFMQGEASRLLFLINAYYSEEDRIKFFSHVLTPDIKFSEFVRTNHMKYRTIAELSDALCMTSQAFSNRFKKVFGMTPHKWMQQEKARQIYLDICRSDMPLKEIAIKYDFPLSSNFFRFCKQTFGDSPGNIRKCLHNNIAI